MTKIYKHRKLHGLKPSLKPALCQIGEFGFPLSAILDAGLDSSRAIYLVGTLEEMTREYMTQPLDARWEFANEFSFKSRTAVYRHKDYGVEKTVKLISHRESWFPGVADVETAAGAWNALESEWKSTGLPLMSTPRATGIALLWESLPRDKDGVPVEFPALDDDLARLIRANSPQHRIESFLTGALAHLAEEMEAGARPFIQHDGRWMYAAMCGLDRFPVGAPMRVGHFREYTPGIYDVVVRIPDTWNHIGLVPVRGGNLSSGIHWEYPSKSGHAFRTWAFEPELTLALKHGWEIMEVSDGYAFEKGRPLAAWSAKLIEMRERLQAQAFDVEGDPPVYGPPFKYAAAAIRQILNHCIGALHKNEFEREMFVSDDNFKKWRRENPHLAEGEDVARVEGGYMVPTFVQDTSQFSIFMPHWTSALYSLARARVAEWALKCDPATLVKIHGDAIYSTVEQPELDKLDDGKTLGRPRMK